MKGTRPLTTDEIIAVSKQFDGTFEVRNRSLFMLGVSVADRIAYILQILLLFTLVGCRGNSTAEKDEKMAVKPEVKAKPGERASPSLPLPSFGKEMGEADETAGGFIREATLETRILALEKQVEILTSKVSQLENGLKISPTEGETEAAVYISKTGSKYHQEGCRYLKKGVIPITKQNAITLGYTPCSVCEP